jgi:Arc/MetJ-type ribon-helix-helix transcriptional regulator
LATSKIAITVDEKLLKQVDRWVRERRYPNRSRAVQAALEEKARRLHRRRLAEEAAKLDRREEQSLAEEGIGDETWPAY